MGTRSLTIFVDEAGNDLVTMYRQFDGYYEGHGKELADFLKGKEIVNGISMDKDKSKLFNGIGCLAAQVIAHLKKEVGGVYIYPNGSEAEQYVYVVTGEIGKEPTISVDEFSGPASDFEAFLESQQEEEGD
jgi:hypothetical protein